jgi:hypothetical protein
LKSSKPLVWSRETGPEKSGPVSLYDHRDIGLILIRARLSGGHTGRLVSPYDEMLSGKLLATRKLLTMGPTIRETVLIRNGEYGRSLYAERRLMETDNMRQFEWNHCPSSPFRLLSIRNGEYDGSPYTERRMIETDNMRQFECLIPPFHPFHTER